MPSTSDAVVVKKNWDNMLAQVEHTLTGAMQAVNERERVLNQFIQAGSADVSVSVGWQRGLEEFLQRLQTLRGLAERAGRSVAEVDTALAAGEEDLRRWLAAAQAARERLTRWLEQGRG
jgi:hypothetical protein